jgi:hypothetical protein
VHCEKTSEFPVAAVIAAATGNDPDQATAECIARFGRYLLDEPALSLRLGP